LSDPPSPLDLVADADGVRLFIHVSPGARREGVGPAHGDALRIAVSAPAEAGKANAACVHALASALDLPRGAVHLDPGSRGRRKRVRVDGDPAGLIRSLHALAQGGGLR